MFFLLYNLVYFPCPEKCYRKVSNCLCITVKNVRAQCHIFTLMTCLNSPLCDPALVNLRLCCQWDGKSCPVLSAVYLWLQIPVCFPCTSISICMAAKYIKSALWQMFVFLFDFWTDCSQLWCYIL